jgi:hypothetical protein
MIFSRRLFAIVAAAAVVVSLPAVTRLARAQPATTTPAMPPSGQMIQHMDHMDHMGGMMRPGAMPAPPPDQRQLVTLPGPMRQEMLGNMRDHLQTLNTVIGDVGDGKLDEASKLLEQRLGMSSLPLHHAAEMAPFFPKPMQDAGTELHHAASRLAIALQDASVARTFDSMREVNARLHDVTSACVACHAAYRVH